MVYNLLSNIHTAAVKRNFIYPATGLRTRLGRVAITAIRMLFNFANATEATQLEIEMLAAGFMSKTDSSLFSVWLHAMAKAQLVA